MQLKKEKVMDSGQADIQGVRGREKTADKI